MKSLIISIVLLLALSLLLAQEPVASHAPSATATMAAAQLPSGDRSKAVARVNGSAITERDLRDEMQTIFPYYAIHGGKVPAKYEGEIRNRALNELIEQELVYQAAKRVGLVVSPTETRQVMREAQSRFSSRAEYVGWATHEYGSTTAFEERVRRGILIQRMWKRSVTNRVQVGDAEVRAFYATNKGKFVRPERISLQTISVKFGHQATGAQKEEARKGALELLAKARAAKTYMQFGLLAEQYSQDEYRVMLGDRGWVHKGTFDERIEKAISRMKDGEVSDPIELNESYMIVRLNKHEAQKQLTYQEIREKVRKDMLSSRTQERSEAFRKSLSKGSKIEVL